jgi:RimJ/RimL family protein N-acetyltransferase
MRLYLRTAKEKDCDLLFNWVNDYDVRKNSFNTNQILYENHKKWFNEKMKSKDSLIFICYLDKLPIGQIRIDIKDKIGVINYSIDKNFRGKGLGKNMMKKLIEEIRFSNIELVKLIGRVKINNIPSQVVFKKLGFYERKLDNYFEYCIFL